MGPDDEPIEEPITPTFVPSAHQLSFTSPLDQLSDEDFLHEQLLPIEPHDVQVITSWVLQVFIQLFAFLLQEEAEAFPDACQNLEKH